MATGRSVSVLKQQNKTKPKQQQQIRLSITQGCEPTLKAEVTSLLVVLLKEKQTLLLPSSMSLLGVVGLAALGGEGLGLGMGPYTASWGGLDSTSVCFL